MNQVTTINASSIASQVHGGGHHSIDTSMMGDDMVSEPSSPESTFDESDLLAGTVGDDVATQLAAAGKKKKPQLVVLENQLSMGQN